MLLSSPEFCTSMHCMVAGSIFFFLVTSLVISYTVFIMFLVLYFLNHKINLKDKSVVWFLIYINPLISYCHNVPDIYT